MIDLSACVPGQRVKYLCGKYGKYICPTGGDFPRFITETFNDNRFYHTQSGSVPTGGYSHPYDVVKILPVETPEEQPMIDLSTCVPYQEVRFQNGKFGFVSTSRAQSGNTEMRSVNTGGLNWTWYTSDGIQDKDLPDPEWRIVEILPVETPAEQPMPEPTPTPQEMDYKTAYNEIGSIISAAFPECEVTAADMARLLIHENRTLRMALGLPSYKQVSDAIYEE